MFAVPEHDSVAQVGMNRPVRCGLLTIGNRVVSRDRAEFRLDYYSGFPSPVFSSLNNDQVSLKANALGLWLRRVRPDFTPVRNFDARLQGKPVLIEPLKASQFRRHPFYPLGFLQNLNPSGPANEGADLLGPLRRHDA